MKKYLIILFLLISYSVYADLYYIAPTTATPAGSDSNTGTILSPWATIGYASTQVSGGDTVYIRGGIYYLSGNVTINNKDGEHDAPICYFNYPDEVPIFDYSTWTATTSTSDWQNSFFLYNTDYLHFKGITIRYLKQAYYENIMQVFYAYNCNGITFTDMVIHHIDGRGYRVNNCDSVSWINCDVHDLCDTLRAAPGNGGTGFAAGSTDDYTSGYYYLSGCRAWHCSDQGFSSTNEGLTVYESCWSFGNGTNLSGCPGCGSGFKFGFTNTEYGERRVSNCIAAHNNYMGFNNNANGYVKIDETYYNNTSYHNGTGFTLYNPSSDPYGKEYILRNNISYANTNNLFSATYTHDHNNWDIPLTLNDADFSSVDSTGLSGARQADGSLPNVYFLKLSATSQAINQGEDTISASIIIVDFDDTAPDLGAYEYSTESPPTPPLVATGIPTNVNILGATGSGIVTYDGGSAVTERGICWDTSADPEITDNYINCGTGLGSFTGAITGLTSNTTYHVRAYATNGLPAYGADVEFTTPIISYLNIKGKKGTSKGKLLSISR